MTNTELAPVDYWTTMSLNFVSLAITTQAAGDPAYTDFLMEQAENAEYMIHELSYK